VCTEGGYESRKLKAMRRFANILKAEILKGLPGTEVQWQMASSDRMVMNFPRQPGPDAKVAAVLILLFPEKGSVHTVLMQRPEYKGVHGGQISFPGGKKEPSDKDIIQTAVREANEETGLIQDEINVIDTLTPLFIPVSNTIVTPVVAWTKNKPDFRHHPGEVVFLFDAEISKLLNPLIITTKPMEIHGEVINVKYFDYDGRVIWGATAMMLHELLTIIRRGEIELKTG
jgi:8-oxo-dGTP pyrophosphatase MutT (NUDIX family)